MPPTCFYACEYDCGYRAKYTDVSAHELICELNPANNHRRTIEPPLPPMQLSCLWEFRLTRAVLLGTTDPGSVLYRLPNSNGVLNIILGFLVLFYQAEVPVRTCVPCAH